MSKVFPVLVVAGFLILGLMGLRAFRSFKEGAPRLTAAAEASVPAGEGLPDLSGAQPQRIVAANAAWVDLLAKLVPTERIAAIPRAAQDYSILAVDDVGWDEVARFEGFTAETLIALQPDLILAHAWQSLDTLDILREAGVAVWAPPLPHTWSDIVQSVRSLGTLLELEPEAEELVGELERRAQRLARRARTGETALSYSNLGTGGWAAGKDTTADILFELAGLENAASIAGHVGHQNLDLEALITLDPDWIVVGTTRGADGRSPTLDYLLGEPALSGLTALTQDRVVSLAPRLFTTASIELLSAAEELVRRLDERSGSEANGE